MQQHAEQWIIDEQKPRRIEFELYIHNLVRKMLWTHYTVYPRQETDVD